MASSSYEAYENLLKGILSAIKEKAGLDKLNIKNAEEIVRNYWGNSGNTNYEMYEGSYDITPKTKAQTLETENKVLIQDMNIQAIPYYETSNEIGGVTVVIGVVKN